ncbi:MAG TPA: glycosyltransferase family 39 protein [Thermoanaerobaculia bacterium]|jgi:4-amino-4-deoxy-L-arabinose transferase-like glycosyltransferase|nr:glycosyltransferase family 39 protein [Thermoanaerobaculia bacterium]
MTTGEARPSFDRVSRALALTAALLGAWLYLARLGGAHLQRGNEAMYASPPVRMAATGDLLVPYWENRPFLDKPPLTFWILAAGYRVLGVSVFASKLPGALAGLGTALLIAAWVRRRAGARAGALAGLVLVFSFQFLTVSLTFAADAFLTLALALAILALDAACRSEGVSDARSGILAGAALALAFYAKGLVGIALPVGAVAAGLLLDRARPLRAWARGAWAAAALGALVAPWHVAMDRRLGSEFWRVFYWENQFLRGATPRFMQMSRGPLYYLGILAWGAFPWALLLPAAIFGRRRPSVFLGWFFFGLVFWSALVMKREVYLVTVLPAAAALVGEGLDARGSAVLKWRRGGWAVGALAALAGLVLVARAAPRLSELSGSRGQGVLLGLGLAALCAALASAAGRPDNPRLPFVVVLAAGLLLAALQDLDLGLGRWDPLPEWGARVRAECSTGCDGFLYGNNYNSIAFASGFDWTMIADAARLPESLGHDKGFVVMWTNDESRLEGLPMRWEVVDRRPAFRGNVIAAAFGRGDGIASLSLVRVEK